MTHSDSVNCSMRIQTQDSEQTLLAPRWSACCLRSPRSFPPVPCVFPTIPGWALCGFLASSLLSTSKFWWPLESGKIGGWTVPLCLDLLIFAISPGLAHQAVQVYANFLSEGLGPFHKGISQVGVSLESQKGRQINKSEALIRRRCP